MPYQNNNNRIVPKETLNVELNPKATPVDKTIKYYLNTSDLEKGNAVSDALIKLGQGLVDIEPVWQRQADEAVLQNFHDENSNAREWSEVSKNIQGFAMFNPYLKDAYKRKQAEEITRTAMVQINSTPNLAKMSNEEYTKLISDTTKNVYKQMQEKGLSQKDYSLSMTGFNEFLNKKEQEYYVKNSEYTYKMYKNGEINSLNRKLVLIKNDENYITNVREILKNTVVEWDKYVPDDEIADMLWTSVVNYAYLQENIDADKIISALSDININGKSIEDYKPEYGANLKKLLDEIVDARFQKRYKQYQLEQFELKIRTENAMTDFFNYFKNNRDVDFDTQFNFVQGLVQKYNLTGQEGFNFLSQLATSRETFYRMSQIKTDPDVRKDLYSKLCNEQLTYDDLNEAFKNEKLSTDDFIHLYDRLKNGEKKVIDANHKRAINLQNNLNRQNSPLRQRAEKAGLKPETLSTAQQEINDAIIDYERGVITSEELKQKTDNIEKSVQTVTQVNEKIKQSNGRKLNGYVVLNGNYVNQQRALVPEKFKNETTDKKVLRKRFKDLFGIVADNSMVITSLPTEKRGKSFHGGYDIGFAAGRPITVPKRKNDKITCKVAAVGFEKRFGNYIVLEYSDGTFVRMGHMQENVAKALPVGTKLYRSQVIGKVGNTGDSSGYHLHIDFWKQGRGLIPVTNFD